jgi:Ca2+-binding EF-hand superfamily protein
MKVLKLAVALLSAGIAFSAVAQMNDAEKRKANFDRVDADKSGGVTKEELKKAGPDELKMIKEHFDAMDANKDGQVTLKERDTFVESKGK